MSESESFDFAGCRGMGDVVGKVPGMGRLDVAVSVDSSGIWAIGIVLPLFPGWVGLVA